MKKASRSRKMLSVLLTLAMMVSVLLPMAAPAMASTEFYTCPNPQATADDVSSTSLGGLFVKIPAGVLQSTYNSFEVELGKDFDIVDQNEIVTKIANDSSKSVAVVTPTKFDGDDNGLVPANIEVVPDDENKFTVKIIGDITKTSSDPSFINIYFNKVKIADGASGDITATITGYAGFTNGNVVIGTVADKDTTVSIKDTKNFSGDTTLEDITILENIPGALKAKDESVKLVLPSGFEWDGVPVKDVSGGLSDSNVHFALNGDDTLQISLDAKSQNTKGKIVVKAPKIKVDESKAKHGDVNMNVRGESSVAPSQILVGTYADFGTTAELDSDVENIVAGQFDQAIADIKICEDAAQSLVKDRTVTLELPANAKWLAVPNVASDSGAELTFKGFVGSDYRTIKYTVTKASSTDAAEITLDDFKVATEPNVQGDLTVTVAGTAGVSADLVVAKVSNAVTVSTDKTNDVIIGAQSQASGDITIKESEDGAIKGDKDMVVVLPTGVKFATTPDVNVTEGDLDIDESGVKRQNDDAELLIPIDNDSNDASVIKISNVKLTVDRTVAEGPIELKVKGDAVVEVNDYDAISDEYNDDNTLSLSIYGIDVDDNGTDYLELDEKSNTVNEGFFPSSTTASKAIIAKVTTPADQAGSATFNIGSTIYNVDGVAKVMDAAPYIKSGRTYVPVRYLALALGVNENDIAYENGVVTFTKGDTVIKLTIGSKNLDNNGTITSMDVAPEIVNGRTMLPARFVAEGFGASVGYGNGQVVIAK